MGCVKNIPIEKSKDTHLLFKNFEKMKTDFSKFSSTNVEIWF